MQMPSINLNFNPNFTAYQLYAFWLKQSPVFSV